MEPSDTAAAPDGISRREVFRAGVAAAAAVAGVTLLASTKPALAAPKTKGALASSFRVRVGGTELKFATGVEIEPVRTVLQVTPGRPPTLLFQGLVPTLTIRIEVAADKEPLLAAWYDAVKGGNADDLRTVEIDVLAANRPDVLRTYRAVDASLDAFLPEIAAGRDRSGRDTYVVRCAAGSGNFVVEDF